MENTQKICPSCNEKNNPQFSKCWKCNYSFEVNVNEGNAKTMQQSNVQKTQQATGKVKGTGLDVEGFEQKRKKGWVAALLNLLLPGVGYMYCGNWLLGLVAGPFLLVMAFSMGALGLVFAPCIYIILIIDGFLAANRANNKLNKKINSLMRACPRCAERVLRAAKVCKHCGAEIL